MQTKHIFTSDQKLKFLGYGEWVEEPDEISFNHNGLEIQIIRVFVEYGPKHVFGGHLCGYVRLPKEIKEIDTDQIDVHGGITYSKTRDDGFFWIGFDCGHSFDIVPATQHLQYTDPDLIKLRQKYQANSPIFERTYRNIEFCINECKSMADQVMSMIK